jgi:hypothetical protein
MEKASRSTSSRPNSAVPNTRVSSVRLRVPEIGEVTGGQCWYLAYDRCNHVQQFAQEGLEDPLRVLLFVPAQLPRVRLTCRVETAPPPSRSRAPLAESTMVTDRMDQPPEA